MVVGLLGESQRLHKAHQANTQAERALSLFFLARLILTDQEDKNFRLVDFRAMEGEIRGHLEGLGQ